MLAKDRPQQDFNQIQLLQDRAFWLFAMENGLLVSTVNQGIIAYILNGLLLRPESGRAL